jgi:hypothetical protein
MDRCANQKLGLGDTADGVMACHKLPTIPTRASAVSISNSIRHTHDCAIHSGTRWAGLRFGRQEGEGHTFFRLQTEEGVSGVEANRDRASGVAALRLTLLILLEDTNE